MSRLETVFRNPYVWAFVIGAITVTALRPFLIHRPEPPPVIVELPAFTLLDQDGRPFGSADLAGRVYVANFFFTSCRSICPPLMAAVSRLEARYREQGVDGIHLVSFSVDPDTDTPERLAEYAGSRGIDGTRWTLLTGRRAAVADLLERGFRVGMGEREEIGDSLIDIAHSAKLVIVDGLGRVRGYYGADETGLDEVFHRSQHVRDEPDGG